MTKPSTIDAWLAELGQPAADRDYKPGHERMLALLSDLPLHKPRLRIRVAGTNGKGSTSFMLAEALETCGLKTGLYTSPHILHFNERIRINGSPVNDDTLHQLLELLMPRARECGASYFEVATALALLHFSRQKVDVEILEAGVGARLDATTAIPADLALITPIALDHQAWLGDTLEQVAMEKAYAMQECAISISAPQTKKVEVILRDFSPKMHLAEIDSWPNLAAIGDHQHINASLALNAVRAVTDHGLIECDIDTARSAIETTQIPGRMQRVVYGEATIWLDAAHNRHAVEALLPTLKTMNLDSIFVFTREDRSLADSLPLLSACTNRLITDADYPHVAEALDAELHSHPNDSLLILGSFTTVAAVLEWLKIRRN